MHFDFERTWRGGQQQLFWLIEGLKNRGHRSFVLCRRGSELSSKLKESGIEHAVLSPLFELDLFAALKASGTIDALRPDIIHLHSAHAHTVGILAAKFSKHKPKVVSSRRVDFRIRSRWKYNSVDRIIAISQGVKSVLLSCGIPEKKISVVHSGVDLSRFEGADGNYLYEEFGIKKGSPVVGMVAALAPHKDHKNFLNAAAAVKKEVSEIVFLLAGDGELRDELEGIALRLGLSGSVIFTGFRKDIPQILSILTVFVMSSYLEGLGTSLIDAEASSLPIVATRVGGIPEVVADGVNGFLVPPGDHAALAGKITELLRNADLRKRFSSAGKIRARDFSKENMADGTEKVYMELV